MSDFETWDKSDFENIPAALDERFGFMGKAELETVLFDAYMRRRERTGTYMTIYQLSTALGMSISRIKTLQERRARYFKRSIEIGDCLAYVVGRAPKNLNAQGKLRIQVEDPVVMFGLREYLSANGLGYEYGLTGDSVTLSPTALLGLLAKVNDRQTLQNSIAEALERAKADEKMTAAGELESIPAFTASLLEGLGKAQPAVGLMRECWPYIHEGIRILVGG